MPARLLVRKQAVHQWPSAACCAVADKTVLVYHRTKGACVNRAIRKIANRLQQTLLPENQLETKAKLLLGTCSKPFAYCLAVCTTLHRSGGGLRKRSEKTRVVKL